MQGPKTPAELVEALRRTGGNLQAAADGYGMPRRTLLDRRKKWEREGHAFPQPAKPAENDVRGALSEGVTITGDTASVTLPAGFPWTIEDVAVGAGLDPDEWIPTRAIPNVWQGLAPEGVIVDLHQAKIEFQRRIPADMLVPARTDGWTPKRTARRPRAKTTPELVCIVSDTHAPYHDPGLHDCHLQWLEQHQPTRAYDFGDLLDLPSPSRHRTTKGFEASPQESIDARYRLDAERVAASPDTDWTIAYGNHDERIDHAIRDKIGSHVARLSRAGDTLPVLDLGFLLRYDELGITVVRPDGDYHATTLEIAPGLWGRHGTKAGKHGGAVKAIERRDGSLGQGHDHKMMAQQHVRYDDRGEARTYWTFAWGAMCQRDLGYVEDPDVAMGFSTITVHPGGRWHHEFAPWDAATQTLTWRDELYQPR